MAPINRRRSIVSLLGASALLLSWTSGASAFHLAKIAERPRVIIVQSEPGYQRHYYEPGRQYLSWHQHDKKHWKKHWKHQRYDSRHEGYWHFHRN